MCCGGGGSNNQTTTQSSSLPPEITQRLTGLMDRATTDTTQPYQAYGGQRVAGFTGDQTSAFDATRTAANAGQGAVASGIGAATSAAGYNPQMVGTGSFPGADLSGYMNPYTQSVINQSIADITRQTNQQSQQNDANAARAGAFGGDRAAIVNTETQRNANDTMARTVAGLNQANFQQAQGQWNADQARQLQAASSNQAAGLQGAGLGLSAASTLGSLGNMQQSMGLTGANALGTIGAQQQALNQSNLTTAYNDFTEQRDWRTNQDKMLSSILQGTPYGAFQTTATTAPGPSLTGQIAGLGTAAVGAYGLGRGLGFWAADGGLVPEYADGGMTTLGEGDEARFQDWVRGLPWYSEFQQRYGEAPNLNDPEYDYRAAWQAGVEPQRYEHDNNAYHWPSSLPNGQPLKAPTHPTWWMEQFMRQTGRDPHELGVNTQEQANDWLRSHAGGRANGGIVGYAPGGTVYDPYSYDDPLYIGYGGDPSGLTYGSTAPAEEQGPALPTDRERQLARSRDRYEPEVPTRTHVWNAAKQVWEWVGDFNADPPRATPPLSTFRQPSGDAPTAPTDPYVPEPDQPRAVPADRTPLPVMNPDRVGIAATAVPDDASVPQPDQPVVVPTDRTQIPVTNPNGWHLPDWHWPKWQADVPKDGSVPDPDQPVVVPSPSTAGAGVAAGASPYPLPGRKPGSSGIATAAGAEPTTNRMLYPEGTEGYGTPPGYGIATRASSPSGAQAAELPGFPLPGTKPEAPFPQPGRKPAERGPTPGDIGPIVDRVRKLATPAGPPPLEGPREIGYAPGVSPTSFKLPASNQTVTPSVPAGIPQVQPGKKAEMPEWALPMLAAGFGMMASKSPTALGSIGEGGLAGVKEYTTQQAAKAKGLAAAQKLQVEREKNQTNQSWRAAQLAAEQRRLQAEIGRETNQDRRNQILEDHYRRVDKINAEKGTTGNWQPVVDDQGNTVFYDPDTNRTVSPGTGYRLANKVSPPATELNSPQYAALYARVSTAVAREVDQIGRPVYPPGPAREAEIQRRLSQAQRQTQPQTAAAVPPAPPGYRHVGFAKGTNTPVYEDAKGNRVTLQ